MNPSLNGGFSPNQATNPQSRVNDTPVSGVNSRCTIPMFQILANTERFADLTPVKCYDVVGGESFSDQIRHELRTYTFGSPLLSTLRKHYAAFFVSRSAISPVNYERMKMAPKVGDDIPFMSTEDRTGNSPVFPFGNLLSLMSSYISGWKSVTSAPTLSQSLGFLWWIYVLYTVYSPGSLLSSLGYTVSRTYDDDTVGQYDFKNVDELLSFVFTQIQRVNITDSFHGNTSVDFSNPEQVRRFFEALPKFVSPDADTFSITAISWTFAESANLGTICTSISDAFEYLIPQGLNLNISYLVAYKLVYSQFFTNDNVDDICTSKKYMQMMKSLFSDSLGTSSSSSYWKTFEYNGDKIDYDVFSYAIFLALFSNMAFTVTDSRSFCDAVVLLFNLFGYETSLVYEDYFMSARLRPLAVEQTLNDPYPSETPQGALQTVRDIAVTRYLNAVNSVPNRIREYVREMYKYTPQELDPQPRYITDMECPVFGEEVVNTAENQGDIQTNMQSKSTFSYSVQASDDAVVLVLTWYDIPRVYVDVMSRMVFHYDRFDDFQPYLQNIGDQPVFLGERGLPDETDDAESPYGYLGKDAEYKQLISRASGGFSADLLKSWLPLYRFGKSAEDKTINADVIRNSNAFIDDFYKSLTGDTLSSYFHFICVYHSNMEASKPMNYVNNILMP